MLESTTWEGPAARGPSPSGNHHLETAGGTGTGPLSRMQIEMTPTATPSALSRVTGYRRSGIPGLLPHLFLLFIATALSWWPHGVLAAPAAGAVFVGSGHGAIHPGEEVTLAWTALPEGADEFELLLVCRSPIPVKLRLTECLDPLQGTFRWRVPNLPCDAARILLRVGVRGEEITWAASPPFHIGWDTREPFVQVTSRGGELWLSNSVHRPRKTWTSGPDSTSPAGLPGRGEDVGAPPSVPGLAPPDASSCELNPYRRIETSGRDFPLFRRTAHLKLQLRI